MNPNNNYKHQKGQRPLVAKTNNNQQRPRPVPNKGQRPVQRPQNQNKKPVSNSGRKKVKINPVGILVLIMIVLVIVIIIMSIVRAVSGKDGNKPKKPGQTQETEITEVETTPAPTQIELDIFEGIYSTNAIIIDAEDGTVLKGLNEDVQAYPASVTKMMTTIVALENIENYSGQYVMPQSIYNYLFTTDLSTAGFERNETVTYEDLLYGTMLRSGAECCLGLAYSVGGSEEGFVQMMNDKAAELGMVNTHFVNCTGEHNPDHYSTVHDMAILLQYGLQNDMFRTLITTSEYMSSPTSVHPDGIIMYNTFNQYFGSPEAGGATLLGAKTGFTTEAGQCLASFASIDGHEYILVTFGASVPAGSSVYAGHLHVDDAFLIYARLAAYLTGGPTPTPAVTETVATTTTTTTTVATTEGAEGAEGAEVTETTAQTTTEQTTTTTTVPEGTYITFG